MLNNKRNLLVVVALLALAGQEVNAGWLDSIAAIGSEAKADALILGGTVGAAVAYGVIQDQITARVCPEYFTRGFHQRNVSYWPDDGLMGFAKRTLQQHENSPTILGAVWGTVATWAMGAALSAPIIISARAGGLPEAIVSSVVSFQIAREILQRGRIPTKLIGAAAIGIPLMFSARSGGWSKLAVKDLIKPMAVGLGGMLAYSAAAGLKEYFSNRNKTAQELKERFYGVAYNVPDEAMHRWAADAKAHEAAYFSGAVVGLGLVGYNVVKRLALR